MRLSLRKKIIFISLSLLFIATLTASIVSTYELQKYYKARILDQLRGQLNEVDFLLNRVTLDLDASGIDYKWLIDYSHAAHIRLTLIDSAGIVLFDTNVARDSLIHVENHISRPEIQMSLNQEFGSDQRLSATIDQYMYYAAKKYSGAAAHPFFRKVRFIRIAIPLREVQKVLMTVRWKINGSGALALLVMAVISYWISSRLTYPIHRLSQTADSVKKGNLEAHFEHLYNDEIGELADLLNQMLDKVRADLIQMRKLEKMRTQFLGNVSHELRTPIFAIQGFLETLLEGKNYDKKVFKKFAKKAYRQAVRLNNLLADLIDISRIESGEMKMSFTEFDVQSWLEKLVSDLEGTASENEVTLSLVNGVAENVKVKVIGDQERLNQVVINLVENAIKYNEAKGLVQVGYSEHPHYVEIYVADTGKGIEEEHIPRIFERFYRVDKERSRAVGGTGLGLAIVKHIVEAHGSQIHVESTVGKGSVFSFQLRKKGGPADEA